MGAYTGAKERPRAVTNVFRKEVLEEGIRVAAVYPGGTDGDFRPNSRPGSMKFLSTTNAVLAPLTVTWDLAMHKRAFRPMVENNF